MSNKPIKFTVTPERQQVIDQAVEELRKRGWQVLHSADHRHVLRSPPRDGKRN